MTMHPTLWEFRRSPCAQPQARRTLQISFLTALHRRIIWSFSQLFVRRRPSLHSSSVSDRNHTPLSGALSQVFILDIVSRNCNHQHSLSATKEFSIRPTLIRKYFELCLGCNHKHSLSNREASFTKIIWRKYLQSSHV
jgi:hypothetical protein